MSVHTSGVCGVFHTDCAHASIFQTLNVTVGGNQAVILNASGGVPVDPSQVTVSKLCECARFQLPFLLSSVSCMQARSVIIGQGPFPQNYTWAINALIPAGQGVGQAVQVSISLFRSLRGSARAHLRPLPSYFL
jgi:hypothetical protein